MPTTTHFPEVAAPIIFEGAQSSNPLAFRHYDADALVGGKTMREHLRFAVCYWHTFRGLGSDMFGGPTFLRDCGNSSDPMPRCWSGA